VIGVVVDEVLRKVYELVYAGNADYLGHHNSSYFGFAERVSNCLAKRLELLMQVHVLRFGDAVDSASEAELELLSNRFV